MENKARYTIVGFFVLTFSIAMVAFVLWLARYNVDRDNIKEYRLYVTKSISGLKPKSIVYYKGLEIGSVKAIGINKNNLEEIEITLNITQPELVKADTFAKVESQGVTGNKVIELAGGTQDSPLLKANEQGVFIIPIKKTFLDNLTQSASSITGKADQFLTRLNMLLNENNMKEVESLLNNANNSTKSINEMSSSMNILINNEIKKTLKNVDKLSQDITNLSSNVNELIQNDVKEILKEFKQSAKSAQNIDEVMVEFQNTLIKLNATMENVNHNGGNILFNTRETKMGPGEGVQQ